MEIRQTLQWQIDTGAKTMSYPRISKQVYGEPWGITESSHDAIRRALASHVPGSSVPVNAFQLQNHFNAQQLSLTAPSNRGSRVYRRGVLAYIPVSGIIGKHLSLFESMCGGYDIDQLHADIDEVTDDDEIENVLTDFDSPGGLLTGVPETAAMLAELRQIKKLVGFTETQACSAAQWLFSQCEECYATESAASGAVGVYVFLQDKTKQLEQQGVSPILIKAGKYKGAGLPGNPLSEEETAMIQAQVDMFYNMMVRDIQAARPQVSIDALQGQVFIGRQAIQAKLIDGLTSLGTLVARLSRPS